MDTPKREADIIIRNYYRYYRSLALSGVVAVHEQPGLQWIMPAEGKNGPMIAFSPRLEKLADGETLGALIEGMRSGGDTAAMAGYAGYTPAGNHLPAGAKRV
ncbi:MAG: hypothetical protein HFG27_10830 [Provencibacterium sp.]|jgi:hypothetical protein|nr:hypothetical protein [Provencibacterium sp.]